jgi:peptidoglycan hydrolase-like protein with peptidoglycan-binding domain
MNRTRWIALALALAVLTVTGVAIGAASGHDGEQAASTTTTTERVTTTTTSSTTTTVAPTTTSSLRADDGTLKQGSHGPEVAALQRRLIELHFDPGPPDGAFGLATTYAVQAFEKLNGMGPDGRVGPNVQEALNHPAAVSPLVPDGGGTRVEVDLRRQVLFLYKDGGLRLITHVSTGSGKKYCAEGDCNNTAITPIGSFRFAWRYSGWRESRLGKLYNPVYFTNSGVAVHGALSVPTYPASHGCVRIPMHIAGYFPSLVKRGDPVYVTDGRPVGPPPPTPTGPPPPDKPTTPGDDTATSSTTAPPPTTSTTTPPTTTTSTPTPTLVP